MRLNNIYRAGLCLLFAATASLSFSQTAEIKKLMNQGEYAAARHLFETKESNLLSKADNGMAYGICCIRTGQPQKGLKYIENAVKRRIPKGQYYLAEAYKSLYRFEEALESAEKYRKELTRRRRPTEEIDALIEKINRDNLLFKGVEKVTFIDSIVVDKKEFIKAYRLSSETGSLYMFSQFFNTSEATPATVYKTELGNKIYYGKMKADSTMAICTSDKLIDHWGNEKELPESINAGGDANYPFVMSDGITIYYGKKGEESMGGYDILVSRYSSDNDTYLKPETVGMPFNSPYNDYMYVIDEFNSLGWFASDRFQPEGKVCIYVFIPNSSKQVYDYESMDKEKLARLAMIHSIKESWENRQEVNSGLKRLKSAVNGGNKGKEGPSYDFTFIINDDIDYHFLKDFKTEKGKELFVKYQLLTKDLNNLKERLEELRDRFANGQKNAGNEISELEKRADTMQQEIDGLEKTIRRIEITNP